MPGNEGILERFHRYYRLHHLLSARRLPVSRAAIERELECSRATVNRIIDDLRGYGAPIEYLREQNGWRYTPGIAFELPGIWFNASELHALLAAQKLLAEAEPGLLDETLQPLKRKIDQILQAEHLGGGEIARRVRILRMAGRGAGPCFNAAATALVQRKRVRIEYHGRTRGEVTDREISPQRLIHYRDNWYLDAWCHMRKALRSFALERIRQARPSARNALSVPEAKLDEHFATAYGIFAGTPKQVAVLRFSAERARWVVDEQWHPRQAGRFLEDGRYELQVPYSDPRELMMDILKFGAGVEVVAPEELRVLVVKELAAASSQYA